jgi:hypothetical protein
VLVVDKRISTLAAALCIHVSWKERHFSSSLASVFVFLDFPGTTHHRPLTIQVSDVPISFPIAERKLRSVVVQTPSPQVFIDQSRRSSSHPCCRIHRRLKIERLFVIDKFIIKAAEMRTTKTHDDIPALRGALIQPNHRLNHLQGRGNLVSPFRGQS